jgi:hypothetical protein
MSALIFHHCRELAHADFGIVRPVYPTCLLPEPPCDRSRCSSLPDDWHDAVWYEAAYRWLADQQGFWPLFLGVGEDAAARGITGYVGQWSRRTAAEVTAGPPPNRVLFSWRDAPEGCAFSDYDYWHIVLMAVRWGADHRARVEGVGPRTRSWVLKPSYRTSDWLRLTRSRPGAVQGTAPWLDLRTADAVWCRNRAARAELIAQGFDAARVEVRRMPVWR